MKKSTFACGFPNRSEKLHQLFADSLGEGSEQWDLKDQRGTRWQTLAFPQASPGCYQRSLYVQHASDYTPCK